MRYRKRFYRSLTELGVQSDFSIEKSYGPVDFCSHKACDFSTFYFYNLEKELTEEDESRIAFSKLMSVFVEKEKSLSNASFHSHPLAHVRSNIALLNKIKREVLLNGRKEVIFSIADFNKSNSTLIVVRG